MNEEVEIKWKDKEEYPYEDSVKRIYEDLAKITCKESIKDAVSTDEIETIFRNLMESAKESISSWIKDSHVEFYEDENAREKFTINILHHREPEVKK